MFISLYIYQSQHVSVDYVPIIRRNNCIYATLGTCYSLWMTVWYAYQRVIQVHQVGFIYKVIQGCTTNKTYNSPELLREQKYLFQQIIFAIRNYVPTPLLCCRQYKVDNYFWIPDLIIGMHFKEFRNFQYSNTLYTSIRATDVFSNSKLH